MISIHAPARGATLQMRVVDDLFRISIHAPARGATPSGSLVISDQEFQSTRPRGARPAEVIETQLLAYFNPRARAGRDFSCLLNLPAPYNFNPRARAGRDESYLNQKGKSKFQSTRPRGARRSKERRD